MRYFRLFGLFLKSNLQAELEYRADFAAQALLGVFWGALSCVRPRASLLDLTNVAHP
jgi:ABC-type uncharacterized transport system permease subunit